MVTIALLAAFRRRACLLIDRFSCRFIGLTLTSLALPLDVVSFSLDANKCLLFFLLFLHHLLLPIHLGLTLTAHRICDLGLEFALAKMLFCQEFIP